MGGSQFTPSGDTGENTEMTRAERRAMKKAQKKPQTVARKTDPGEDEDEEDEDEILTNPNRIKDNLKVSDSSEPKALSRKER